ncbi:hypothetical protein L1049_001169 [Liquidambar formosana]|uniref:Phytocyanin domain-containing protein n=1 Tax=Liquidambar formosana TaxID=63359 RepID=A0AAP0NBV8_LIQFO
MEFHKFLCLFLVFLTGFLSSSQAYKFYVGGKDGWVLHPSENYTHWAERNRFQVNDTLFFKYKKGSDSVLVVSKDDYYKCNTDKPIMKMEDGDSVFKFDRSGLFFFISGNNGTCEKGQKLIVLVLAVKHPKSPFAKAPAPVGQMPAAAPKGTTTPASPSPVPAMTPTSPSSLPAMTPTSPSPVPAMTPTSPSPVPAMTPTSPSPVPAMTPTSPSPTPAMTSPSPVSAMTPTSPSLAPAMTPISASPVPAMTPTSLSPLPAMTPTSISPATTQAPPPQSLTPASSPQGNASPGIPSETPNSEAPAPNAAPVVTPSSVSVSSVLTLVLSFAISSFI